MIIPSESIAMTDIKANKATMSSTDFAFLQPRQKLSLVPSNAPEPSMPSSNSTPRAQRSSTSSVEPQAAENEHDHTFADNATTEYKLHPARSIERLSCPSERTPDPRAPRYVPEFKFVPESLDYSALNLVDLSSSESSLPQTPESSQNSDRALSASCTPQRAFDSTTANAHSTGNKLIRHQNHESSSLNILEDPQKVQEPFSSKDPAIPPAPEFSQGSPVALQALHFSEDGADDMYDDTDEESDEEIEPDHRIICIDCGNKGFEPKLLRVYGFDLARAASLMPSLHAMAHENRSFSINMWNNLNNFKGAAGADEQTGGGSHTNYTPEGPSDNSLQGQQMGKTSKDPREDEDQNEEGDGRRRKRKKTNPSEENPQNKVQYACPFNKRYPEKYNCGKLKFKTCNGPGFAEYRLLKSHLETVHTNVQCERCSTVFEGPLDNRIKAKEEHVRECFLNPPTIAEGISNVQWNKIKKIPHNIRVRKDGGMLRTDAEKWKDTWEILFPSVPLPEHLWCDASYRSEPFPTSTTIANQEYLDSYGKVLSETLDSQVYQAFLQSGANITAELLEIFQATASKAFDNWFLGSTRGQHALTDPDQYIANQAELSVDVLAENSLMAPFNVGETSTSKPLGNRPEKLLGISSPTSTPFPGAFNTNAMGQNFEIPHPRSISIPTSFSTPQPTQGRTMGYAHQYPSMSSASHSNNGWVQSRGGNGSGFGNTFYGNEQPGFSPNYYPDILVSPFSSPASVVPVMGRPYEAPLQSHSNFNNFNNGTHHPNQFNETIYPSNQQSINIGDGNLPLHGVYGNGIAQHQQPLSHMQSMRLSAQSQNLTEPSNFPSQDSNNDNDISNGGRNQSNP